MSERGTGAVVRFSEEGGVGTIVFDRPPANAYELNFHRQFNDAIKAAEADSSVRAVIIRSAVPRFFCAGADIKLFAANSTAENREMVDAARSALARIEASGKPYIACIEGHTLGGGLEIALACDIRIAAEGDYKLGLPEVRLGLLPGNGGSQRLPRIVGPSQAMLLLTSGENIDPPEALRIGLLNRLYPAGEARGQAEAVARAIATAAPLAVSATKKAVWDGMDLARDEALALESRLLDRLYDTEDAEEGFNSAVEKRAPVYKGR